MNHDFFIHTQSQMVKCIKLNFISAFWNISLLVKLHFSSSYNLTLPAFFFFFQSFIHQSPSSSQRPFVHLFFYFEALKFISPGLFLTMIANKPQPQQTTPSGAKVKVLQVLKYCLQLVPKLMHPFFLFLIYFIFFQKLNFRF